MSDLSYQFLIFFYFATILANSSIAFSKDMIDDNSQKGKLAVEVVEFREVWDSSRNSIAKPERFRLFKRGDTDASKSNGKQIPIKVHFPNSVGPYPLIVISHGAGGNWDTHYAQASHLASHGYVVLCLEHTGSNTERMKSSIRIMHNLKQMIHDSNEVLGRPKDISFAINQAAEWNRSNGKLRDRIDLSRIGVMGHSFGAYTTMVVGGMRPALNWIVPKISPGKGLGPDVSDERVKCGVALSPQGPGDPFFLTESYSSLKIPLMGISGTKDKQQNGDSPSTRLESFRLWPNNQDKNIFVWLSNAGHLDFTDSTGGELHGMNSSTRAGVHTIVRAATLMFFNKCLKSLGPGDKIFTVDSLKPYLKGPINNVEVFKK
jgi:predicted dienelactone hydrolase